MAEEPRKAERPLMLTTLALLVVGCLIVLRPFVSSLLWAVALSFALWPVHGRVLSWVGGRRGLAALLMTFLIALVLLLPFVVAGFALADDVADLAAATRTWIEEGPPAPPEWLSDLPLVGRPLSGYWAELVADSARLRSEMKKLVEPASAWVLGVGMSLGRGLLEMALSILIAFFLFRDGVTAIERLRAAADRLAGARGGHLLETARSTARGVVYGVLGTAIVQAIVAGVGFLIAGVPGALLLALLTFFFSAVVPFGPPLVWIPATLWLFNQANPGWGIFMAIWGLGVSSVDNIVRPLLIQKETNLPFILVFLGVLGGILTFGFVGVFLGPTLLAVGYKILVDWVATRPGILPPAPAPATGE